MHDCPSAGAHKNRQERLCFAMQLLDTAADIADENPTRRRLRALFNQARFCATLLRLLFERYSAHEERT